jgi:hypothetical protein
VKSVSRLLQIRHANFVIFLFLITLMHLYALRWNVDVYHEGDKFPSSVKIAQGGVLFRDINNIYGFLQSYITAIPIKIFGIQLIWSRIIGVLIKFLIVVVSYKILVRIATPGIATTIPLLWYATSPIWSLLNSGPSGSGIIWPTHFSLILVLYGIYLIQVSKENFFQSYRILFLSGAVIALSWGGRLEFFLSWFSISVALLYITTREHSKFTLRHFLIWICGSFTIFLFSLMFFLLSGAFSDWFNQTLKVWFSNPPAQPHFTVYWFTGHLFSFLFLSSLYLVLLLMHYQIFSKTRKRIYPVLATLALFSLFTSFGLILKNLTVASKNIGLWFYDISIRQVFSYVDFAIGLSLALICNSVYQRTHTKTGVQNQKTFELNCIMIAFCISLLSLFHIVYADYLSIVVLPFLILCVIEIQKLKIYSSQVFTRILRAFHATCVTLIIIAMLLFVYRSVGLKEFGYKTPILYGLVDQNEQRAKQIDTTFRIIQDYGTVGHVWMFCISGLYSTNSNGYLGADKWLWNLQPEEWMSPRILLPASGDLLVVCNLSETEKVLFDERLRAGDFRLIEGSISPQIFQVQ